MSLFRALTHGHSAKGHEGSVLVLHHTQRVSYLATAWASYIGPSLGLHTMELVHSSQACMTFTCLGIRLLHSFEDNHGHNCSMQQEFPTRDPPNAQQCRISQAKHGTGRITGPGTVGNAAAYPGPKA